MTRSPPRASPARANLHRLDEPMNPMTSDTLLPCPFCGGDAVIHQVGNEATRSRGFEVNCQTWGCATTKRSLVIRHSMEEARGWAVEAWNTRALLPKGVDGGGNQEVSASQSQPVLVSNDQTEAERSARKALDLYECELIDILDAIALQAEGDANSVGVQWTITTNAGHWRCLHAFIGDIFKALSASPASPRSHDVSQDAPILTSNGHSDAEPSGEES